MKKLKSALVLLGILFAVPLAAAPSNNWDDDPDGIKVFILAGQSNMVGYGKVEEGNIGGDLIFTFRRKLASMGGVSLTFQWSSNLTFPALNAIPINATSSSFDGINVAISNFDVATETIVVTVPSEKATDGKLFGRLQAAAP